MESPNEEKEIADIILRLEKQFPSVPADEVASITREVHRSLDGRPIRNYVPVLVEREAKEKLAQRASAAESASESASS